MKNSSRKLPKSLRKYKDNFEEGKRLRKFICIKIVENFRSLCESLAAKEFETNLFNKYELRILTSVLKKCEFEPTEKIIDISHEEPGWIENEKHRSDINYQKYSFELKAM
ncbi:MAG: hypothetical protein ABI840_02890 [bacterium]